MATAFANIQPEGATVTPLPLSEQDERERDEKLQTELSSIVSSLQSLADKQVQRRGQTETRWLNALRAFHGRYDDETEREFAEGNGQKSRAFVKITRKKCNSWEARLSSLLFPTDEENWDIRPTPVPTLSSMAKEAVAKAEQAVQATQQAATQEEADAMAAEAQTALDVASEMTAAAAEARKRSEAMRAEMRDQLVECNYASHGRRVIRDAVRLGTGILKGPMAGERQNGKWVQIDGKYKYTREEDPAPVYEWVDVWSYFPDMSATTAEDREFEFQRHLWSAKELRRLVRENGFNKTAVRELLADQKTGMALSNSAASNLSSLRSITGSSDVITDRFIGWEYHGPLATKDIATILRALGREGEAMAIEEQDDPLLEMRVIAFFCDGKLLRLSPIYPLDSGESLYSIFTFEESEANIFGYGVPDIMEDSQKSMNGAWRMALDNAGLSVGPQVFVDRDSITPANGSWAITPRKLWYKKKGVGLGQGNLFEVRNIDNNVAEIMKIVEVSRRFIDDETALPVQAEGELTDNPNVTATATNFMSMASNITFRRVVKNFDDGVTTPSIRRLYDWNMQHSSRDDIKGDMKVDARGSGALLQRELQAQMLLNIAQNWSSHPVLGLAVRTYDALAETLRASMIQPDTLLYSREEFEKKLADSAKSQQDAAASASDPQKDPQVVAANLRLEAAKIDADARTQVADMQREVELLKAADRFDMKIEDLKNRLAIKEMDIAHQRERFVSEVAVEDKLANDAAARGQQPSGSGGSISQ